MGESVPSKSQSRSVVNKRVRYRLTGGLGDLVGDGGGDLGNEGFVGEVLTAGGAFDGDGVALGTFVGEGSTLLGTGPFVSVFVSVDGALVVDALVPSGVSEGAAGVPRV